MVGSDGKSRRGDVEKFMSIERSGNMKLNIRLNMIEMLH